VKVLKILNGNGQEVLRTCIPVTGDNFFFDLEVPLQISLKALTIEDLPEEEQDDQVTL